MPGSRSARSMAFGSMGLAPRALGSRALVSRALALVTSAGRGISILTAVGLTAAAVFSGCSESDAKPQYLSTHGQLIAGRKTIVAAPEAPPPAADPLPPDSPAPEPPPPLPPEDPSPEDLTDVDPGLAVEDLAVRPLSTTLAKVVWWTPHRADSEVRWGLTPHLEATPILDTEDRRDHCVLLAGLRPGVTYYCQAVSTTPAGTRAESAVVPFAAVSEDSYAVRSTRPRIFFNRDDLPVLQQRIRGSHADRWTKLVASSNNAVGRDVAVLGASPNSHEYARALAFAGLLKDDAILKGKAVAVAGECARLGTSGDKMDVRRRLMGIACVYDWIHDSIPSATRGVLRDAMIRMVAYLEANSNESEFIWGHSHGNQRPMVLAFLALYGDWSEAPAKLDAAIRACRDGYLASWRSYADSGGSLKGWWYTSWTLNMEVEILASLRSAAGIDWFASDRWMEEILDWYLLGLRGDRSFCRGGDSRIAEGVSPLDWVYALCVAHHYRNPQAKWLAERVEETIGNWTLLNFYDILWNPADLASEAPTGGLTRHFRAPGEVILRSSWGDDAAIATFRSAPTYTLGHSHRDNNSFTLYYRAGLALDSGIYDTYAGAHHLNYYSRTIAHNSILVHDPAERFVLYGKEYANDGGQRWLVSGKDVPSATPPHIAQVLDPRYGYRAGGIVLYEDAEEYSYSVGDAAPSYSPAKLVAFDRHFLWLKSVRGSVAPVVVILDRVDATSASFKKTYVLHTQGAPQVQGAIVRAANGRGQLVHETLLPRSPRISAIGGSGKEFWVNGQNHAPSRTPSAAEEAGAWRVEVSPSTQSLRDVFLHVLFAGEVGAVPPSADVLAASSATGLPVGGLTVGEWVVVVGTDRDGARSLRSDLPGRAARCLLVGLVPNGTYDLLVDGTYQARLRASSAGSIRFDVSGGARLDASMAAERAIASGAPAMLDAATSPAGSL